MKSNRLSALFLFFVILTFHAFLSPRPSHAQGFDLKANYVKSEHPIPMRDGKKLHTVVYAPKDASQKYPILITRTPKT